MNIGIDLGTTNTVVSFMNVFGNIEFLRFDDGSITLPSCIYSDRGNILVGSKAVEMSSENPSAFISSSKSFMDDRTKCWDIEGKRFKAEDVAFEILKKIRITLTQRFPDEKKFRAVVTVPAKFGEDQIKRTASAVKRAGFSLIEILKEPVAAVLAYNDDNFKVGENVYVVDIGGGTIDVALIELKGNDGVTDFNVIVADGIRHLGGNDFDEVICNVIAERFKECSGQDIMQRETVWGTSQKHIRRKIEECASRAKIDMYRKNSDIVINAEEVCSICEKKRNCSYDGSFSVNLTYSEFISMADDLYDRIKVLISDERVMEYGIDHVLLVGGMSRDPYIRQYIEDTYSDVDIISAGDIDDEEKYLTIISRGAAIKACDKNIHVINKLLNSLGIICRDRRGKMYMSTIIDSGTDIDEKFEVRHVYTNSGRFETEMRFEIYEYNGDPEDFSELAYRKIGEFVFNDIDPMDTGKQRIETVFSFNSEGVMEISAVDLNDQDRYIDVSFEV